MQIPDALIDALAQRLARAILKAIRDDEDRTVTDSSAIGLREHDARVSPLLNEHELQKRLPCISKSTLGRWRKIGDGPRFIKAGRRVLYRQVDVDAWLRQQTKSFTNETPAGVSSRRPGRVKAGT